MTMTERHGRRYRLEDVIEAITSKSTGLLASGADEPYAALDRRWREIGGMLELARRLNDHRLVRALEAHKDALRHLLDTS
jgi:hypothetical protein